MKGMKGFNGGKYLVGNWVSRIGFLLVISLVSSIKIFATPAVPVEFAWDASADPDVTGYAVYYGVVNSSVTNRLDAGASQTATFAHLQAKTNYFFYVAAYTATGLESDPSNVIEYSPPAITCVKLTELEDGAMRIQFRGPAGALCRVEYSESLVSPQWQTLASAIAAEDGDVVVDDPQDGRSAIRFYRGVAP
jgi:Fibronectin type III domain